MDYENGRITLGRPEKPRNKRNYGAESDVGGQAPHRGSHEARWNAPFHARYRCPVEFSKRLDLESSRSRNEHLQRPGVRYCENWPADESSCSFSDIGCGGEITATAKRDCLRPRLFGSHKLRWRIGQRHRAIRENQNRRHEWPVFGRNVSDGFTPRSSRLRRRGSS